MPGTFGHNGDMLRVPECFRRHAGLRQWMAFTKYANLSLPEKTPLKKTCLEVRQEADGEVDSSGLHFIAKRVRMITHGADRNARRNLGEPLHEGRKKIDFPDIGHRQGERTSAGCRVEVRRCI